MHAQDMLTDHLRLQEKQKKALEKLRIKTVEDLLYHFPSRYNTVSEDTASIANISKGDKVILYGTLSKLEAKKAWRKKTPMATGVLSDSSGSIDIVWFNQPYIAKMIPENAPVKVEGVVSDRSGRLQLSNPEVERVATLPSPGPLLQNTKDAPTLFPMYPESRGVTSRWFYYTLQKIFTTDALNTIEDPIPKTLLKKYNLPTLKTALVWIHTPRHARDARAARKRFAFEEVFLIQLKKQQDRRAYEEAPSFEIVPDKTALQNFVQRFPFTPTKAQQKALDEIVQDIATPHAMSRLLEGDVGSGKTFVAAASSHVVVTTNPKGQDFGNLQVAYMAPTEILSNQLFESFIAYFKNLPIQIGLITSSGCKKFPSKVDPNTWTTISRTQLLKWVANGEIPILIGTHSLIQKTVEFKHLAYIIIDEQHRFGTMQRQKLAKKGDILPHLLSMTATPIPRTLALTIYGDLDLTLLDEMPPGRKEIITEVVTPSDRDAIYERVREELQKGRQAYVITPRIDEPDPDKIGAIQAKSVKTEAKRLQEKVFPEYRVGILHGKLRPKEKATVMQEFAAGDINVLAATSVVEVGVDVPNATVIIIEGAERFGLAQLHQLRGRVLRSTHQAYCYIFPNTKSKTSLQRLKVLAKASNGFALAEKDLELRGAGELYGRKQWGISDIGMEAIKNIKMVEAARKEAQGLINKDPELKKLPLLAEKVAQRGEIHFE